MPNLFDYLAWRGDLSLEQSPFQDVDNLILCSLAYAPLETLAEDGVTLRQAAERHLQRGGTWPEERRNALEFQENALRLLGLLAESRRFGGMKLYGCVNCVDTDAEEQFSALTIDTGDGARFVAYRGTDSTLVGWKEDFNMSYQTSVPAQRSALEYLRDAGRSWPGLLRLGGHSKGGNLAVYAAALCPPSLQRRLAAVYNNDGPGFCAGALDPSGYEAVRDRIRTFVPQSSVVGMLLDHEETYTVVRSRQMGIFQHDPFSWQILGPDFIRLETVTDSSRFVSLTLKQWVASMDRDHREAFVDTLFDVLEATGAATTGELSEGFLKNAGAGLSRLRDTDDETRRLLLEVLRALLDSARSSVAQMLPWPVRRVDPALPDPSSGALDG